jgi:hypothetical protein
MRTVLGMILVLVLACRAGSADTKEADKSASEMFKLLGEVAMLLEGVKDEKTADANIPKIDKKMVQFYELGKKLDKLPPDDQKKLKQKYQKRGDADGKRVLVALEAAVAKVPTRKKELTAALMKGFKRK